jgi:beta-galactosidase
MLCNFIRRIHFLRRPIHGWRGARPSAALVVLALVGALPGVIRAADTNAAVERFSFNSGWRFIKGDPAGSEGKLNYDTLKPWLVAGGGELSVLTPSPKPPEGSPGADISYTQAAFDDSSWSKLNLPHDWGIEGPFKQEYPGATGKLPWWGVGWYRKHFQIPASDNGKRFFLDVDGAMAYASVWLNGQFVGGWPYGYSSWRLDLTPQIKPGADNVIAIRLDNPTNSSRWYPGGGIYRNVWLVRTAPVHIGHWGVYVTTPNANRDTATVNLKVDVENQSGSEARVDVTSQIYELNADGEKAGRPVASLAPTNLSVATGAKGAASLTTVIRSPRLWSLEKRSRYVAVTRIEQAGKIIDTTETPFGIRTIQFTADNGFLLNGRRVAINGVCDHHDLGALGAAINVRALERQVELLQEMGCNAIRTSHNPPAPELLEICDRLGMLVMDEAFDCWVRGKNANDYHLLYPDWHEKDLRALVRRDRNHPSVILWSIGNEISEQGSPAGQQIAAELAGIVHSEDPTRPVTAACNSVNAGYNGFQKQVDVFGYNYKPGEYGNFKQANPDQPLVASETASCVSSRGEYFFPISTNRTAGRADFQVSSYDLSGTTTPDMEFRGQDQNPFVAGEFVWTGFDYLGEPTPYGRNSTQMLTFTDPAQQARMAQELEKTGQIQVPSRSSYFGILDLAGFKKDRFYLYQARWRPDLHVAHILPHWNWPERVGQVTPVQVYTSGDEAELFLNGKSLGRKKLGPQDYRLRWDNVVYQPGELSVVAYKNRSRWAHDTVKTTGPANKLSLDADRSTIVADGQDLSFVTVAVTDWAGQTIPRAKNQLAFDITGPGEIVGLDNGDPTSFEPFQGKQHSAFNGLCLVIVRSTGQPGQIVLKASATGLKSSEVKIQTKRPR